MNVKYTDGSNEDFITLCHQLDVYLNDLVGGEANRAQYIRYNALLDIHDVWVAYLDHCPVGCASYRKISSDVAEIKRVYVHAACRCRGIAKHLIAELETYARQQGYRKLLLETGRPLVAATQLYQRLGYVQVDRYGPYVDMPESICMEKLL